MCLPAAAWLTGMAILFHPTVLSGFRRTQVGLGDGRLVNHVLEHGYRWVMRHDGHQNFWNVPLFHPETNVTAYTDVLLGAGPLYWVWRWIGCDPDTAFQLWMITVRTLNYVAAYWLLRRCFGVSGWAATCGAYLMTFTVGLRVAYEHPQLAPMFYVWLAVGALQRIFAVRRARRAARDASCFGSRPSSLVWRSRLTPPTTPSISSGSCSSACWSAG